MVSNKYLPFREIVVQVGWERLIGWILTLGENIWGMDLWRNYGLDE